MLGNDCERATLYFPQPHRWSPDLTGCYWRASLLSVIALMAWTLSVRAAVPRDDSQAWMEADMTAPITTELSATLIATSRESLQLPNPTLVGGGLSADWRLDRFTLTAGAYAVQIRGVTNGATTDVELPFLSANYSFEILGVSVSDRNRIEDLVGIPGAPYRFRNRLGADLPLFQQGISHVFATDELFYDFATSRWNRNRAQLGFGVPVSSRGELQLFYLRQDNYGSEPRALNVLGLTFKVDLRKPS